MKMKKLLLTLLVSILTFSAFSQTTPPAPGTGKWLIVDTNYTVGASNVGVTKADLYYRNTTNQKITGMQFRVWYDKDAFNGAAPTVALKYPPANQYMQYVTNATEGNITVTLVYTGTSAVFSYLDTAAVEVTLTHAAPAIWNSLDSIKTMKITGTTVFNNLASTNLGNDTTLTMYSYGGHFLQQTLTFKGKFLTPAGDGAKNLYLSLEKKPKTGSTWTQVNSYMTNNQGRFQFTETLDTTYWDTRIAVKGDTMSIGNILSTADAQKINQTVLSQYTPTGFDFYTMDINNSNSVSITDAYGVFSRLAGNFPSWPNSTPNVLFFTEAQRNTINGSTTSLQSTIAGVNNFTYYINGGLDSVTYYVAVKGDANSTGFHMARLVPIPIVNPAKAPEFIIDNTVIYDNTVDNIEINMPKIKVEEGNLINIPVKVLTNGKQLGSLQLHLKYDESLLEFKKVENSEKAMKWISYLNPDNGVVAWGGFDITNENLFNDGEQVFTLQFLAKQPQNTWNTAVIWTSDKYVGDKTSKDIGITPAMGIVEVKRLNFNPNLNGNGLDIDIAPNPNNGNYQIAFNLVEEGETEVAVFDIYGKKVGTIVCGKMPAGEYLYSANFNLANGLYFTSVTNNGNLATSKTLIIK
jgi:hypothetical protein